MNEKSPEHPSPFHLLRCVAELGGLAIRELFIKAGEAIDAAWPADCAEDAEIRSKIWDELNVS